MVGGDGMSEDHAGEGTYTYDCDNPDCHYCHITTRPDRDDISFRKNGWSVNDIKFLKANYATMKPKDIARQLNKSIGAVWVKACDLDVTVRKRAKKLVY